MYFFFNYSALDHRKWVCRGKQYSCLPHWNAHHGAGIEILLQNKLSRSEWMCTFGGMSRTVAWNGPPMLPGWLFSVLWGQRTGATCVLFTAAAADPTAGWIQRPKYRCRMRKKYRPRRLLPRPGGIPLCGTGRIQKWVRTNRLFDDCYV